MSLQKHREILKLLCKRTRYSLRKYLIKQSILIVSSFFLMAAELGVFFYFFLFSGQTLVPAFCLSCFIFTLFVCIVLRLYTLSKRPEVFDRLINEYLTSVKRLFSESIRKEKTGNKKQLEAEEQSFLSTSATKLAEELQNQEYFLLSNILPFLPQHNFLRKFSCFCFWKDYFHFRENLLQHSVEACLQVVQLFPTNIDTHVALAAAYVALSGLYADPRKYPEFDANYWVPPGRYEEGIQSKFFATARRATEEFKILNEYAPGTPWVHAQLAFSYHDLQMPLEEIQEYEVVLRLTPEDVDTMIKLGSLYFQQGMNAKGLKIYEEVKKRDVSKSQKLIKFYAAEGVRTIL